MYKLGCRMCQGHRIPHAALRAAAWDARSRVPVSCTFRSLSNRPPPSGDGVTLTVCFHSATVKLKMHLQLVALWFLKSVLDMRQGIR